MMTRMERATATWASPSGGQPQCCELRRSGQYGKRDRQGHDPGARLPAAHGGRPPARRIPKSVSRREHRAK
jgi:hypothetical protein